MAHAAQAVTGVEIDHQPFRRDRFLLNRANGPGDALAGSWGDPIGWAREALAVFVRRGDDRLATRCREVLRRAPSGWCSHPARSRRTWPTWSPRRRSPDAAA